MKKLLIILLCPFYISAQKVEGNIIDKITKEKIELANILLLPSKIAISSDENGYFSFNNTNKDKKMIVSASFYSNDTINIESKMLIELSSKSNLEAVIIKANSSSIDELSPMHTEILTAKTLAKAACCNLSESFETNASVSVNYSDAVTGAKQIQMLGLSGNYIQTNIENIPGLRGLGYTFGLNYIPGTWIQTIDISKGAGSVLNGYENMAGAINVELKKPENSEKLFINTYLNSLGRGELNINASTKINKNWSYGFLGHGSSLIFKIDKNKDNFLDLPTYGQINLINRVKFESEKMMFQAGIKYLNENRTGGEIGTDNSSKPLYVFNNQTQRIEFFTKTAKLFPLKPYKGFALILNGVLHDGKSNFGFRNYTGVQKTLYANLIYQGIFGNTNHTYKTGLSYLSDTYDEQYISTNYKRQESVPGIFAEYSFKYLTKFNSVLGIRYDKHNLFGNQFTPRLHLKYDINPKNVLRASVGRGFKIANIFAENYGYLISQREVKIIDKLNPEVSWNFGGSYYKDFEISGKKTTLTIDYFRTQFQNQVVLDAEHQGTLYFYNLKGESFSNSFQSEINFFPTKMIDLKVAYRFLKVEQSLGVPSNKSILLPKMFVSPHRFLFNAAYARPFDKWKYDFTTQWNSKKRIPDMSLNGIHTTYSDSKIVFAPSFFNINAQITRTFKKWDTYLGGENLGNFTQKNPIIAANEPFSKNFDAGMAWGPIVGRVIYWGVRYKIK